MIQENKPENNPDNKPDLKGMSEDELKKFLAAYSQPSFRASQIYGWIHKKLAADLDEMTNIPASLKETLSRDAVLNTHHCVQMLTSKKDGTRKFLFELSDHHVVESVLMPYHHGNSVCISSQVGCRMGCAFCASGIGGRIRNLTASEMLEEVYSICRLTKETISNIVIMGTGEPLDNYDNLVKFLELICSPAGMNISRRNITVSTCGLVGKIRALADEDRGVTLALSLHASSQEKREKLMPIARKYALADVLDACRYYFEKTGRRVTFEYALVKGENDTPADAKRLGQLLRDLKGHVNLIPVNPVAEKGFSAPDRSHVIAFQKLLEKNGINATIRREMGQDISGACGQLRRRYLSEDKNVCQVQE